VDSRAEFIKAFKKFMDNQKHVGPYVLAVSFEGATEVIGNGDKKDVAALTFEATHEVAERIKKW